MVVLPIDSLDSSRFPDHRNLLRPGSTYSAGDGGRSALPPHTAKGAGQMVFHQLQPWRHVLATVAGFSEPIPTLVDNQPRDYNRAIGALAERLSRKRGRFEIQVTTRSLRRGAVPPYPLRQTAMSSVSGAVGVAIPCLWARATDGREASRRFNPALRSRLGNLFLEGILVPVMKASLGCYR
jgi:hypothetical protein